MTMRNDATRQIVPVREKRRYRAVVARQGQVLLDSDFDQQSAELLARIEQETRDSLGLPGRLLVPAGDPGFLVAPPATNPAIRAGRGYLGGWLLDNAADATFATQPHPRSGDTVAIPTIVALKALVRHIDPVEETALADVALGDAQASGRALTDWQVFPFRPSGAAAVSCATVLTNADWLKLIAPSQGTLAVVLAAAAPSTDPCSLTPGGGYTRLENLLYRIEVHGGVARNDFPQIDGPRFGLAGLKLKVSRRNASTMVAVTQVAGNKLTVSPPMLDSRNWFVPGAYAEIVSLHDDVDPRAALANERLFRVADAGDDSVTLEGAGAAVANTGVTGTGGWFLRLWDALPGAGAGIATTVVAGASPDSNAIDLGDGLSIVLGGGGGATFRRGDHWTFAARADGTIDWPKTGATPLPVVPHGPETRYAPLASVAGAANALTLEDCRIPFATLSDKALLYRGGDGQSIPAAGPPGLPAKLRVAVMRGETPVAGARVRWRVVAPAGSAATLAGPGASGSNIVLTTGSDGLSDVAWTLDPGQVQVIHQVEADLEDGVQPGTPPIVFSARFHAEENHPGCSTYVIEEDSDWVTTLEQMDLEQDVAICFQRGVFKTSNKVSLNAVPASHKRNIRISGAGDGTVILAKHSETALEFNNFASVTLHALRVETGDALKLGKQRRAGRNGSVTTRSCEIVDVSDMTLRCGGQDRTERTCLTIAGDRETPVKLARVMRNRFLTGYLQDGVLITDCIDSTVSDNEFVPTGRSDGLGDNHLIHSKGWQKAVVDALIGKLETFVDAGDEHDIRVIVFGQREARFVSPVPQSEWQEMADSSPLRDIGAGDDDKIVAYLERIAGGVAKEPDSAPISAKTFMHATLKRVGEVSAKQRNSIGIATLLPGGIIVGDHVKRPKHPTKNATRGVQVVDDTLRYGRFGVRFTSPLALSLWQQLRNDPGIYAGGVPQTETELGEQMIAVAHIVAGDAGLRRRFDDLARWYGENAQPVASVGRQAVTCAGDIVRDVTISGNTVRGFIQGAHVGASVHPGAGLRFIANARIADNNFYQRLPSRIHYAPCAVFLGNSETGRIDRNLIAPADPDPIGRHQHGIRVWGLIGRFLMIAENRIENVRIGIRVEPIDSPSQKGNDYLWVAQDNLVLGVDRDHVVVGEYPLESRNNRPN